MRELALAVCALLAFLVPVGSYCFMLALVNRRPRPLIVRGVWDAAGLIGAGSGFFLITMPMLLTELHFRLEGDIGTFREFLNAPVRHWLVWLVYFLFLVAGGVWMLLYRWHKTMVYNVDAARFRDCFQKALASAGLAAVEEKGHVAIGPIPPPGLDFTGFTAEPFRIAPVSLDNARHADVRIDAFPALSNVTLHWNHYAPELRGQIEAELDKALESAAPEDNPAAGWFLTFSGLVFGALFMIVLLVLIVVVFPK